MYTYYKYIEYVRIILNTKETDESIKKKISNEHTNFDFYYTFSKKKKKKKRSKKKKIMKMKRLVLLTIRIYYSLFFQLLGVKGIKSHDKKSISLVYVLHYLKPKFSLSEIKQIIIENVIEDIKIIIPDSSPEITPKSKEEIISIINEMIDSYLTPDSLHCDRDNKFYTYLCMAKVFFDFNCS